MWIVEPDGDARRVPYDFAEVYDVLAVDPAGPIYQNDYPRNTVVTWEGDEAVNEAPFPQCERLTAAYGLVACTTGSLEFRRSGPVVVDPGTGEIVAYAPIADRNAVYSDNGRLTSLGFLDEDTVLLLAGPRDSTTADPGPEAWYLVSWRFRDGTFQRIASGDAHMQSIAVAPSLVQ